jgi:1-acyl-sn-glycerol-3-phosphate acyltransferase
MLKAKHHKLIFPFFRWYTVWQIRKKFGEIHFHGVFTDRKQPVLLIANHVSWWDGFWALFLNMKKFSRNFHFMMEEDQLKKYWYFNHCGGFSVRKNSREILTSLAYSRELLQNPDNLVLIFPQGEIQSIHRQHFRFEKGIGKIAAGMESKIQLMMVVFLTDYFSSPKPGLYIYFSEFREEKFDLEAMESAYNRFYTECLYRQCNRND